MLIVLYAPFLWLLWAPEPERARTLICRWPLLPVVAPTMSLSAITHHKPFGVAEGYFVMIPMMLIVITALLWLGSRNRWILLIAASMAFVLASISSFVLHMLYLR